MNLHLLVIFLGIIMISSTISISSSEAFLPANLPDQSKAPDHVRVIEGENLIAYARPLYTSVDNPVDHEVPTSDSHDGVAKLILDRTDFTVGCSGTLASDGLHIITAAHCVTDDNGIYILESGIESSATFEGTFEGNFQSIKITIDPNPSKSKAHPDYDGDFIKGNDIAVLELLEPAPIQIPRISHANAASVSAVDNTVDKNGYGHSGFFSSGADSSTYPFGTEREGHNKYDAFADIMYIELELTAVDDFVPEAIYQYDSDDDNSPHDAFGFFFDIDDTGLGNAEVISAPGDSGGPTILNQELVGVVSYGITLEFTRGPFPRTSDCTLDGIGPHGGSAILDSSCGEFAGDTRVSAYAGWIDSVLTPEDAATLVSLSATPTDSTITVDSTQQFSATGTYSDDTTEDLTQDANIIWTSSTGAATIDATGEATGVSEGDTVITAEINGITSNDANLHVDPAPVNPTTVTVFSVEVDGEGGRYDDKHVVVTVVIKDDFDNPVSGASVITELYHNTNFVDDATGTTSDSGTVTFSLKNPASGTYVAHVTNVVASGLSWIDTPPVISEPYLK